MSLCTTVLLGEYQQKFLLFGIIPLRYHSNAQNVTWGGNDLLFDIASLHNTVMQAVDIDCLLYTSDAADD